MGISFRNHCSESRGMPNVLVFGNYRIRLSSIRVYTFGVYTLVFLYENASSHLVWPKKVWSKRYKNGNRFPNPLSNKNSFTAEMSDVFLLKNTCADWRKKFEKKSHKKCHSLTNHSWQLEPQNEGLEDVVPFQMGEFRFHVSFPGLIDYCTSSDITLSLH